MKHIGWCLDRIQIEMAHIPKEVVSKNGKKKAKEILSNIEHYEDTLKKIITNSKFRSYLRKLEHAPEEGVRLQAHEIDELVKDLEHMLQVLRLYIEQLFEIIQERPEEWSKKADQLVLMIDQKFCGERGELRDEFKVAVHTEEQLRELEIEEHHMREFLK